jgi:hypothetical protein
LEKRTEQVLPGSEGGVRVTEGVVSRGRNDPNNACTHEYMNKEKKIGQGYASSGRAPA